MGDLKRKNCAAVNKESRFTETQVSEKYPKIQKKARCSPSSVIVVCVTKTKKGEHKWRKNGQTACDFGKWLDRDF